MAKKKVIKVGNVVNYTGGQDSEGAKLFELKEGVDYHVWQLCDGNFEGQMKPAVYLKEAGTKCAFLLSMFKLKD